MEVLIAPPLAKTIERINMRKEHPRPQFVRDSWLNLNGQWTCDYSKNIKGFKKSTLNKNKFSKKSMFLFVLKVNFLELETLILCKKFGIKKIFN
jgi:hypothetical protein